MLKAIKQARTAFSLLNPDEVRRLAGQSISFGLVAMGGRYYADMEDFLIPAGVGRETRMKLIQHVHRAGDAQAPDHVDLVLYQDGIEGPREPTRFARSIPRARYGKSSKATTISLLRWRGSTRHSASRWWSA